ncbi:MAG: hypothetical protein ACE5KI_01415, partial [Dehalococcoidia bacterium]
LASLELPPATDDKLELALVQCILRLRQQRLKDLKAQEEYFLFQEDHERDELSAIQKKALEVNSQLRELHHRALKITSRSVMENG